MSVVRSLHAAPQASISLPTIPSGVAGLALTSAVELALAATVSVINALAPSPTRVSSTLDLNGDTVIASSPEQVTSFYGRWTYLPGAPSVVQGEQQFAVVDPKTGTSAGSFDALVSRGNGYNYTELLVTSDEGSNVGTGAGQLPPVGSLISSFGIGPVTLSYTAIPTGSGDKVSFRLVTPLGSLALPMPFDAAAGIADYSVDSRPVQLTNGYSIAPAVSTPETYTGTSGILPFFTTVQGRQVFTIDNPAGVPVGSFEGVVTTTADILGTYTQAILVTANDGTNVGLDPGQVPPVGSVYNVVYSGSDQNYVLYSSMPAQSGDPVAVSQVSSGAVATSDLTLIDASEQPATQPFTGPNGTTFVPVSTLQPTGVNGLPPREVQIQGYQQFAVYDSAGTRIGSVDADVYSQWDLLGIRSQAILVTDVTAGTTGTSAGQVPAVGSEFNVVDFGTSGFATADSVTPTPTGDVNSFSILTPVGNSPTLSIYTKVADRAGVTFADPFTTV